MTSEWVSKKLLDVAKIVGGGTPSTTERSYWDGDVPWITPKDLSNYKDVYISNGGRSITDLGLKESSAKLVPKGTVLFTSRAPIGYVAIASQTVCTNQGFKSLVLNEGYDSRFFYYLLKQYTPEIEAKATGSTFKEISGYALGNFEVVIPDGYIQIKIADFLSAMDDRITLLRETNSTLEAIAQALFKSWFVDFDPVRAKQEGRQPEGMDAETAALFPDSFEQSELGEIPKGWHSGTLNDLATLNPETWGAKNQPSSISYIDLANTKENQFESVEYLTFTDAPSRARRILRDGDTIVGTVRPGNRSFAFIRNPIDNLTASTGFAVLRPIKKSSTEFIFLASTQDASIEHLTHIADGAAYPAVRPDAVSGIKVLLPPDEILLQFHQVTESILSKVSENHYLAKIISNLRDTLLPQLISGQLRLPDAEEQLEAATAKSL